MTLTKQKPRRPTNGDRKRQGHHHHQNQPYLKTYWPYLPMVAILVVGVCATSWLGHLHRDVLGYATDMSVQNLLTDTNAQREQNSEGDLTINSALNSAAQAKANDMAARNYWSHNTPDGQTPWSFMTAAGYTYLTAGENLAYGFDTAADTVTGWMNSPEHRANILNTSYHDVGFGIVNVADYQNSGPETLVVAMYGSTESSPIVASTTPAATPAPKSSDSTPTASTPPASNQPVASPIATTKPAETTTPPVTAPNGSTADIVEPTAKSVTQLQLVASTTPLSTLAVSMFGVAALGFVVLRHGFAWRKLLVHGEAFVLHHPMIDIVAVSIVSLSIVASHTVGLIR